MDPVHLAAVIDPGTAIGKLTGWVILAVGLVLIIGSIIAGVHALKGRGSKVILIIVLLFVAMIPGTLAVTVGWQAIGKDAVATVGGSTETP